MDRRSFIAELGKLISFMSENDKSIALTLYNRMFDEAQDESKLLSRLASPTRQAVNIARVYKKDEDGNDADSMEEPQYISAILAISDKALNGIRKIAGTDADDTDADVSDNPEISADVTAKEEHKFKPDDYDCEDADEQGSAYSDQESEEEIKAKITAAVAAVAKAYEEFENSGTKNIDRIKEKTRNIYEDDEDDADSEQNIEKAEDKDETADPVPPETEETESVKDIGGFADSVIIKDEITLAEDAAEETENYETDASDEKNDDSETEIIRRTDRRTDKDNKKKTNILLAILYIIVAVPLCAAAAFLCLAVCAALSILAFYIARISLIGIATTFGCYAVFSDILLVIGVSLIGLAASALMVWTGIWLVGGVCVSLIKKAIKKAEKICTKEA